MRRLPANWYYKAPSIFLRTPLEEILRRRYLTPSSVAGGIRHPLGDTFQRLRGPLMERVREDLVL